MWQLTNWLSPAAPAPDVVEQTNSASKEVARLREDIERQIQISNIEKRYNHGVYPDQYLSDEFTVFRRTEYRSVHMQFSNARRSPFCDLLVSNYGRVCWFYKEYRTDGRDINISVINVNPIGYTQYAFLNKKLNLEQIRKLRAKETDDQPLTLADDPKVPNIDYLLQFLADITDNHFTLM